MKPRPQFHPLSLFYFTGLGLALAGLLGYHAFVSPAAQFLGPAADGRWIVHPDLPTGEPKADFSLTFELAAPPPVFPVKVTALRSFELEVNGRPLAKVAPDNWKTAFSYDLAPDLRIGANEVRVHVYNRASPPALLVEGPEAVRSDQRWVVDLPSDAGKRAAAAVADHGERYLAPKPNLLAASPRARWWSAGFVLWCMLLAATLVPRRGRSAQLDTPGPTTPPSPWPLRIACFLLLAVVAAVHLRNAAVYPLKRGFDPIQHAEYVQYMAANWRVPYANEGWEMSQPPLYYALGAVLYTAMGGAGAEPASLKALQMVSPVAAVAMLALAWWMLAILFPGRSRMRWMGFVVAALLPVTFYLGAQVSNEVVAAFVIGAATCLATRQMERGRLRWRDAVALGLACGLGLLSKFTGLFVFLAVLSAASLRTLAGTPDTTLDTTPDTTPEPPAPRPWQTRLRHLGWGTLAAGITLATSGWLYARNLAKFGTPFIGAWDQRSGFRIVQPPGYHTADFYTRFGSVFWNEPSHAPFSSIWDGMYGTLWGDSYLMFLSRDSPEIAMLAIACLWLGLLPTVAILLGFGQALWRLFTRGWNQPLFIPVVTTALTVTAMISFTLEHPLYSAQKAHWGLSILPCAAAFAAIGLETMCLRLGPLRWLVYLDLAALAALVPWLFWYRGPYA
ncbi:MAG: hypothetical protein ABR538_06335 [Candidatus Binatia bacterium]